MRLTVGAALGIYLLLLFALDMPWVQQNLARSISAALSNKIHSEVSIKRVEMGLFNYVVAHDVVVYDQQNKKMLQADLMSLKIELAPLLNQQISLRSVSLLDAKICLYKASAKATPNYQFVLDAFKSKEKKQETKLNLRINSVILRRCDVTYDEQYKAHKSGKLDLSHTSLSDIDANISLKCLTEDSVNLRVRTLKFKEHSGLAVKDLTFRLAANRHRCEVENFALKLPHSQLVQKNFTAAYDIENLRNTISFQGELANCEVSPCDLSFICPPLKKLRSTMLLSLRYDVGSRHFGVKKIELWGREGGLKLSGSADIFMSDSCLQSVKGQVGSFYVSNPFAETLATELLKKPMPQWLHEVGDIKTTGTFSYVPAGNSLLSAALLTELGTLDIHMQYDRQHTLTGAIKTQALSLPENLSKGKLPRHVRFNVRGTANLANRKKPEVKLEADIPELEWRDYLYKNISLQGALSNHLAKADISISDMAVSLEASLQADVSNLKNLNEGQINMTVHHLAPKAINATSKYGDAYFSGEVSAKVANLLKENMRASLYVRDFSMVDPNKKSDEYHLHSLHIDAVPLEQDTHIYMVSDFASASFNGKLSPQLIKNAVNKIITRRTEKKATEEPRGALAGTDHWDFAIKVNKTDFFNKILQVPLSANSPIYTEGTLYADGTHTSLTVDAPHVVYGETELRNLSLYAHGDADSLGCIAQVTKKIGKSDIKVELHASSAQQKLATELLWDDGQKHRYAGSLKAKTEFSVDEAKELTVATTVYPTIIAVGDTIWQVEPGNIVYRHNSLQIEHFALSHDERKLQLSGCLSKNKEDVLNVLLKKMDVNYLISLIDFHAVEFDGLATGEVQISMEDSSPRIEGKLYIPNFLFNQGPMGDANILLGWNTPEKKLEITADMRYPNTPGDGTRVEGFVSIAKGELDLHINSQKTRLQFLRRFVSTIFDDLEGEATGYCHLYGPFKQLDFEGKEQASASAKIIATGTAYNISDATIDITPGVFAFTEGTISDGLSGKGSVHGWLRHNHLRDLRYHFELEGENLLLYNKGRELDMPFYARAIGSGAVQLNGFPGSFSANIRFQPSDGTELTYILDSPDAMADMKMLYFREAAKGDDSLQHKFNLKDQTAQKETAEGTKAAAEADDAKTDIRLNITVDANPKAAVRVIMDEKAGDNILVYGSGPIEASFYNKGAFKMFGTYTIDRGVYKMSIQDVIRKNFEFQRGSRLMFAGEPYDGTLDLKAIYVVNSASLSDLNIGSGLSNNSVRVNCILNIGGKVNNPEVSFDLDLPTVSDEEKQMVRSLIASEEDMNMQILYLLGVGRFYTYNFSNTEAASAQSQSSVAMKSFLSNTLSSQLNDILSNAIGSNQWSFGANLSTGAIGWSDMEVEGLLSGRLLDNRLLINGNFGYRDRPTTAQTNFVGDFDIQYLLTPSGNISLKVYSESNDRYFTKSSLTTQGAGILLKRDFSSLKDLFSSKRRKRKAKSSERR